MPRPPKPPGPAWKPGQSGNPKGRPIGNRNKLNEKFILALHDDFVEHGREVIEKVREDKPDIYLKVIASILPRELHFKNESAFDGMTNDQLDEILGSVRAILATRAPTGLGDGKATATGKDKPDQLH
jgi:Family of unknown function (DUF5681)